MAYHTDGHIWMYNLDLDFPTTQKKQENSNLTFFTTTTLTPG